MNPPSHVFVINLLNRPDRLSSFQENVKGFPFEVTPWDAVRGDLCPHPDNWLAGSGAWGCYKSHLNIMEHCLNSGIGSYMVFEDDAQFKKHFLTVFQDTWNNLPDDWDQLYLGGQLLHTDSRPPVKVNDHIYRVFNVNRTHCFAVSRSGMEKLYPYLSNLPFHPKEHIDHHLGRWHEDHENKVYTPPVWTVGQHGSSSSVSGATEPITFYDDPVKFSRDHWLYRRSTCVLYQGPARLIPELRKYLHFGNSIGSQGFDVTLDEASKYRYPGPKISEWFNWIRSECVGEKGNRLPAAYHPFLTEDELNRAGVRHVVVVNSSRVEDIVLQLANIKKKSK